MRLDPITLIVRSGLLCQVTQSEKADLLYELAALLQKTAWRQVKPDDHSEVVPLLPIPNRTVKRLRADDSAGSRVKVGHRQALTAQKSPARNGWAFLLSGLRTMRITLSRE